MNIRHVLRMLFEFEGFEVISEAANGLEAVAMVRESQPALVILDYAMPRMSGSEAASFIKTLSPESRIVAFSAHLEAQPEWAHAFLNKERIGEIVPLLNSLLPSDSAGAATELTPAFLPRNAAAQL